MFSKPNEKKTMQEKIRAIKKTSKSKTPKKNQTKRDETYLNQLRYARADLENLQKHIQKRIEEGIIKEKSRMILQILPILDDVDHTLNEAKQTKNSNLLEVIKMIRKKIWKILSCEGLSPMETIGKPFDPNKHEALQEVETCDCPEGSVFQEVRKGYLLNGKVFRASLVKVACAPDSLNLEI
jgi:molecular chaperone GrpE